MLSVKYSTYYWKYKQELFQNFIDGDKHDEHQITQLLDSCNGLKLAVVNTLSTQPLNTTPIRLHYGDTDALELELSQTMSNLNKHFQSKILKNLHRLSLELKSPIFRIRQPKEMERFWEPEEDNTPHLNHDKFPSRDWPADIQKVGLYTDRDLLELVKRVAVPLKGHCHPDMWSIWSAFRIPMKTPSIDELGFVFKEMHPKCINVGLTDLTHEDEQSFMNDRIALGLEVLKQNSSDMARQYAKQGVPSNLRPQIWQLAVQSDHLNDRKSMVNSTIYQLKQQVARYDLLVDKILQTDIKTCQNDDNYFVFEDSLREILLYWSRDPWVKSQLKIEDSDDQITTYNGCLPVWGISLYAMPVCYLHQDIGQAYVLFRELYTRFFYNLHTLDGDHQILLYQCVLFENLLKEADSQLYFYLSHQLGMNPIDIAFKWIIYCFVGVLEVDQVLYLWDRIIGFDNLSLLSITAAALFCYRRDMIMECKTIKEVHVEWLMIAVLQ